MSFVSLSFAASCFVLVAATVALPATGSENDARAGRFIDYYTGTVRPAEIEAARAVWAANITGSEADYQKKQEAEERLDLLLSDPERFAELKTIHEGKVADPLLSRQITILYLQYLDKQVDRDLLQKMLLKSNAVERAFNVFRPQVNGKPVTDNEVRRILRESPDPDERRAAWEAGKKVGPVVVGDLLELVILRNQAARKLGFKNYHVLQLYCGEQSQAEIFRLFDELDERTRGPFHEAKAEIDAALAKRYGITPSELRPWHYHDPFFQDAPAVLGELPDSVYKPLDIARTCREFYGSIGLPVDDMLKRSSLYESPGKNPHAFCIDIDRAGDVRILENIVPGREWLGTTLHELGHAVYSKNVSAALPYVLHTDAHPLCTEGVAMFFEQFAQDAAWLRALGAKIENAKQFRAVAAKLRRHRLLVFSRYCQVMFRFEAALYDDPRQDLNRLWWDLVERYQELKRPDAVSKPDFAGKYHFIGAPAYYHNYLLGEMFSAQLYRALARDAGAVTVGNKAAGAFVKKRVFEPGLSLKWDALTEHATGQPLSPEAFVESLSVKD